MNSTTAATAPAPAATATAASRRRPGARSVLRRAGLAVLPALMASTMLAPTAGAMRITEPSLDDGGTTSTGTTSGTSTTSCGPTNSTRYRVTVQRFRVTSATYDDPFQWDGKGDEVMLRYKNVKLAADGRVLANYGANTTVQMGDRNGYEFREKAGSLSNMGGLRAGDVHTTNKVLWEGDLRPGEAVVITPTIWEWDGGGNGVTAWSDWASKLASRLSSRAGELFDDDVVRWITLADIGLSGLASMPIGSSGDKAIGSRDSSTGTSFTPEMLVLDHASATEIVNSNPIGEGQCVVGVDYVGTNNHGAYTLYLKVERV